MNFEKKTNGLHQEGQKKSDVNIEEKVDQSLIEKYGKEFFEKLIDKHSTHFNVAIVDHIEIEEKILENKVGKNHKSFIVSFITYGDSFESEGDFIVKKKYSATMDNHIYGSNSGTYTNFPLELEDGGQK